MKHNESRLTALDGLSLYAQAWLPDFPPKATICLIHGLGEHSGRYGTHFATAYTQAGFNIQAIDLRGHGKSGGQRGYIPSLEAYLNDIDLLIAQSQQQFPGLPVFLYGHSLGGILVLSYALQRKPLITGVVASAPGLRNALEQQKFKIALTRWLAPIAPAMNISSGLDPQELCHDPTVISAYRSDPLVHYWVTPRFAVSMQNALNSCFMGAAHFPLPLLLMHGTSDQVAYPSGSEEFARLAGDCCTLKLWEGLQHELHNEPEKEQVMAFTINWMNARLSDATFNDFYSGQS